MTAPSGGSCLFCRIAAGEVPSHAVHSGDRLYAFLDIRPIRPGHVQIVPRAHHAYFDELPPDLAAEIVHLGRRLAPALKRLFGVSRVGFLFTGNDIAHADAHVAPPLHTATDITSRRYIAEEQVTFRELLRIPDAELAETAAQMRDAVGASRYPDRRPSDPGALPRKVVPRLIASRRRRSPLRSASHARPLDDQLPVTTSQR